MVKRSFDVISASIALLVLSPAIALIALLVRCCVGKPVLFRQLRPGLNGRPFEILKFRTMTDARDSAGRLLANEKRLTRFGRSLRSSSLDELPELINVIRGDMSLVGPRPLKMEYLELYSPHQARRHEMRPGITGWAQVCGRNAVAWGERFEMDVWYVENRSFLLDLKIIWLTLVVVLRRDGVTPPSRETMEPFRGGADQNVLPKDRLRGR